MMNKQRRNFLRLSTLMIASSTLPACSGGGGTSDTSRELVPSTQRDDAVSNPMRNDAISDPIPPAASTKQVLPAWLAGRAIGECIEIPGSAVTSVIPASAAIAWAGYAVRHDTNELFLLAQGGHGDSSDNSVVSIDISADSPAWVVRNPPTPPAQRIPNVAYYADGKPTSRHTYDHAYWVPQANRFILHGCRGRWQDGGDNLVTDGFNPDTNQWDPAGTWVYDSSKGTGICVDYVHGRIWTTHLHRFDPQTNSYDRSVTGGKIKDVRYPVVYDPLRDQMFCLMWGDGGDAGYSSTLNASRWPSSGAGHYNVTFNPSAAYTQFLSEWTLAQYEGMTYDSDNDCFYWYDGHPGTEGHLYVIKPPPVNNPTANWDMSLFQFSSPPNLPATILPGLNGRIKYFPLLKGFILCPTGNGKIYFVRTA